MFVILQKYDFSSKSQRGQQRSHQRPRCLWYCKSTIFQANHNMYMRLSPHLQDVCDTAKVRFFKQITTNLTNGEMSWVMFVILQKYDFSSKSQLNIDDKSGTFRCLWYCKSTIFQANHNQISNIEIGLNDVCDTAKVRFFKQITTGLIFQSYMEKMFVILQKYDFSSKSQPLGIFRTCSVWCLWYCKSTIFQANHNDNEISKFHQYDVCDTAKVRFFKQITTAYIPYRTPHQMFVILQKYDFSSKSQRVVASAMHFAWCLWYCKSTIFQANHNCYGSKAKLNPMFVILQKYDFSSKSQLVGAVFSVGEWCLWYCKSTIFQANHNSGINGHPCPLDVCDTAKVRFFKQITTLAFNRYG